MQNNIEKIVKGATMKYYLEVNHYFFSFFQSFSMYNFCVISYEASKSAKIFNSLMSYKIPVTTWLEGQLLLLMPTS